MKFYTFTLLKFHMGEQTLCIRWRFAYQIMDRTVSYIFICHFCFILRPIVSVNHSFLIQVFCLAVHGYRSELWPCIHFIDRMQGAGSSARGETWNSGGLSAEGYNFDVTNFASIQLYAVDVSEIAWKYILGTATVANRTKINIVKFRGLSVCPWIKCPFHTVYSHSLSPSSRIRHKEVGAIPVIDGISWLYLFLKIPCFKLSMLMFLTLELSHSQCWYLISLMQPLCRLNGAFACVGLGMSCIGIDEALYAIELMLRKKKKVHNILWEWSLHSRENVMEILRDLFSWRKSGSVEVLWFYLICLIEAC